MIERYAIADRTKAAFKDAFVVHSVRSDIIEIFGAAGIESSEVKERRTGDRRGLVDKLYSAVDWNSEDDVNKALGAWETFLLRLSKCRKWQTVDKLDDRLHEEGLCFKNDEIVDLDDSPNHGSFRSEGIWDRDSVRLFVSHVSESAGWVKKLADELEKRRVSAFVAHVDIDPGDEWRDAIDQALGEMDALVAVLAEGFRDSVWTHQECGYAVGADVPVLSIRRGEDPAGLIDRWQAISGGSRSFERIAGQIIDVFKHDTRCKERVALALAASFASSRSWDEAQARISDLEEVAPLSPEAQRVATEGYRANPECRGAAGVEGRLRNLVDADL